MTHPRPNNGVPNPSNTHAAAASARPSHRATEASAEDARAFWRRLLHRWLVQYNPMYLLSAALVLGGMSLLSRGFAAAGSTGGQVGVAAIAELYAFALIGGAAILTRIGLRRPGVMLALLAALYQCDLTLHTETSAYLGRIGIVASAAWVLLFWAKLRALAWAVHLRLSRSAQTLPLIAAVGLGVAPHVMARGDAATSSVLVTVWLFALACIALWTSRKVESTAALDAWGETVLRRAVRGTWVAWTVLLLFHVAFWRDEAALSLPLLLPALLLLSTRFMRREASVFAAISVALGATALASPASLSLCAGMASVVLVLQAFRHANQFREEAHTPVDSGPYRTPDTDAPRKPRYHVVFALAPLGTRVRMLSAAVFGVYLALWTISWSGGAWPAHVLALDLLLTAVVALMVYKARARTILVPLTTTYLHFAVQIGVVSAPATALQWGATCVGVGFALLIASVLASVRLQRASDSPP